MAKLIRREAGATGLPDDMHPLLRRIYSQRGVSRPEEIDHGLGGLEPPDAMLGIDSAVELLLAALRERWKILIVADYDADGATSCALAIEALFGFGFDAVDYIIPDRIRYGYGLTTEIVELAACREPDLLITVDNGVSSIDGVAAARAAGMRVLVTDHHLPGDRLPDASALVNPSQAGCNFPWKNTAGVGVIFYVMAALRGRLRKMGWFGGEGPPEPDLRELLDLVALGTVADVVSLDRNNRILVNEGLRRIRAGRTRPGIKALFAAADPGINPRRPPGQSAADKPGSENGRKTVRGSKLGLAGGKQLEHFLARACSKATATELAFRVAPRLNAAGRLEDMSCGIECLLAEDAASARDLALQLDEINTRRREIQAEMDEQAVAMLASAEAGLAAASRPGENAGDAAGLPTGLCLYDSGWHQGVVGVLASRIKDRLHRPVIAFAGDPDNPEAELKGSARSIGGFHIRDALDAIASRNPGLISRFGGHAMAAGLSLAPDKLEQFRTAFDQEAARQLRPEQMQAVLYSDGALEPEWFTLDVAGMLRNAGPWGKDFPEPLFDGDFLLHDQQVLKEKHLRMELSPKENPAARLGAIAFNVAQWPDPKAKEISLAYRMDINEFRGQRKLQLVVEEIFPVAGG